ncbi:hypothetical protein I553_3596 [Mycobacterium xenopi 4042]|uniref:Uncharacterized protein n=1 Tax=Mycobacterium xenopi 4042 TaxID=1299334 RepID=X8DLT7_MYCXE|nr:hypothetical protein I553_3596 [Mycobacterium xenopi 4042]
MGPNCPAISDKEWIVRHRCDDLRMSEPLQLRGTELRYVLTMHLFIHGPATVAELADALAWHGFAAGGRHRSRSRMLCAGRSGTAGPSARTRPLWPGWMPRGTEHRIHKRVQSLRDQARCR